MSVYVIADLHLSSDGNKSMEVFGSRWNQYMEKIQRNWCAVVTPDDTVIVPGDISWSLKLEDSLRDLRFLDQLPGKKLIGKGNHDFWWSTVTKMNHFLEENGITSIEFLYNNAFLIENQILCGTRGWFVEENQQHTVGTVDYKRIVEREAVRLRLSLEEATRLQTENGFLYPISVFLHFPPAWGDFVCREILDVLHEYHVKNCYFGHIHGAYYVPRITEFEGIRLVLCAADHLNFTPTPIYVD
jgi:predicted phosphohydrolase